MFLNSVRFYRCSNRVRNLCGVGSTAKETFMLKLERLSQSGFGFGFSQFSNPVTGAPPTQYINLKWQRRVGDERSSGYTAAGRPHYLLTSTQSFLPTIIQPSVYLV